MIAFLLQAVRPVMPATSEVTVKTVALIVEDIVGARAFSCSRASGNGVLLKMSVSIGIEVEPRIGA